MLYPGFVRLFPCLDTNISARFPFAFGVTDGSPIALVSINMTIHSEIENVSRPVYFGNFPPKTAQKVTYRQSRKQQPNMAGTNRHKHIVSTWMCKMKRAPHRPFDPHPLMVRMQFRIASLNHVRATRKL